MIMRQDTIVANTTNQNVLAGSAFEFARGRGILSCGVGGSATGLVDNIQAGSDIVAEAFDIPILTIYPKIPDEMYFTDVVEQGDRIVIRSQNTTGGNLTHRAAVQLSFGG
jgi:hypothetical protein